MRRTGIVIPCYNEAERLDLAAFLAALAREPDLAFLFVDDGSTDSTLPVLENLKAENPQQIELLPLAKNSGKAEAVRRGILTMIDKGFDYVGYWDADLATPLEEVPEFCAILADSDLNLVIGSRVLLLGKNIHRRALRHYVGRVFATCASLLLQIAVYDTQCGAKLFRNSVLLRKVFERPFKVNWTFDVEIMARLAILAKSSPAQTAAGWYEQPLKQWIDVKGSKVTLKDYFKGGFEFLTLLAYLRTPLRKSYENYLLRSD